MTCQFCGEDGHDDNSYMLRSELWEKVIGKPYHYNSGWACLGCVAERLFVPASQLRFHRRSQPRRSGAPAQPAHSGPGRRGRSALLDRLLRWPGEREVDHRHDVDREIDDFYRSL